MSKLKPKRLDKIRSAFEAVDKVAVDRSDTHDISKIKELEDKMDENILDASKNLGINSQRNFNKKMQKSYKRLK